MNDLCARCGNSRSNHKMLAHPFEEHRHEYITRLPSYDAFCACGDEMTEEKYWTGIDATQIPERHAQDCDGCDPVDATDTGDDSVVRCGNCAIGQHPFCWGPNGGVCSCNHAKQAMETGE